MKDYIRIFGRKISRKSLLYKFIRLAGKSGAVTGPILAARKFDIKTIEIKIKNLPSELKGFKILHLTDIHAGDYIRKNYIERVVKLSNQQAPDITVITGDFTETDYKDIYWSAPILAKLKAKYGVYGVSGNHDIWNGYEKIMNELEKNNIEIIDNKGVRIKQNGASLFLAGISDHKIGNSDIRQALENQQENEPTVLLSHNPDAVEILDNNKVDIMLAGHIHGGQWCFPLIGPLMVPSKYGRKHAWGLTKYNNTYVYTSKGIGTTTIPLRINCPPEIVTIKLI